MRSARTVLLLIGAMGLAMTAGCQWLGMWAGAHALYVVGSEPMTKAATDMSNSGGAAYVGQAVTMWLDRNQLPMPVLPEGPHDFSVRVGVAVDVKRARGARVVELLDGPQLIAEYVVAWDKTPEEYRLVSATNRVYEGALDVSDVPVIQTYHLD